MEEKQRRLVVGLGNKGEEYKRTRHNLGALVVEKLAKDQEISFERDAKAKSAIGKWSDEVFLALPKTYMNDSGYAVKRLLERLQVKTEDVLVVVDDAAIDFGAFRFRHRGSTGGHRGLENIEQCLQTADYARLRVGIGAPEEGQDLADFVLEPFSKTEEENMPDVLKAGCELIKIWLQGDYEDLAYRASQTKGESA